MHEHIIYAAGAMSGVDVNLQKEWREELRDTICTCTNHRWTVFNPCLHVSDFEEFNMTDREMMDYDIYHLLHSDLVIVNFAYNPNSIGTTAEMGAAYSHHIPMLGLNEEKHELHPWQKKMLQRIFTDWNDMIIYIVNHYLNEQ